MEQYQELEVKLLNIDKEKISKKLVELGATGGKEVLQVINTYDCYDPILLYQLGLSDYKITKSKNSLQKISNIYEKIEPIISDEERKFLKELCGYETIREYITENYNNISLDILENETLLNIIKDTRRRFFNWIRLRQNGDKIELTIKYIYNDQDEYELEDVKEVEILVNDFDTANKLVEEMGYFRTKKLEKKRIEYKLNNLEIVIDDAPMLEPYIEIEGNSSDEIYDLVNKLGYTKEDVRIINVHDLYKEIGINLNEYEVFTFEEQIKK